jgi:four helix bundle protein
MDYKELEVWKESKELVKLIYELTKIFPSTEQFGLTNQIRRCAVSIPSNIAEGIGRNHVKDTLQFLFIARGSIYELETQIILAFELSFISNEVYNNSIEKIHLCMKLISGFINYYEQKK